MPIVFDSNIPIYLQVLEYIQLLIITNQKKPGEKLESVRELAMSYGVNPNTVQKALTELERMGLVRTQRTTGRFVTEDIALINEIKQTLSVEKVREFIAKMQELGNNKETIITMIDKEMGAVENEQ